SPRACRGRSPGGAGRAASEARRPPAGCGSRTRSSRRPIAPCPVRAGVLGARSAPAGGSLEAQGRVVDPVMIDAAERAHERLGDVIEIAACQIALIELPVED